jgi:energy-coupling factor transporter ATP-binding protein EcfA2
MLVLQPKLLILDEPTYGLDEGNVLNLVEFIFRRLREQGVTVVLITHDMRLVAEHASRVIVINEGAVVHDGTPASLFGEQGARRWPDAPPPPVVELAIELRERGWEIPHGVITSSGLVEALTKCVDAIDRRKVIP